MKKPCARFALKKYMENNFGRVKFYLEMQVNDLHQNVTLSKLLFPHFANGNLVLGFSITQDNFVPKVILETSFLPSSYSKKMHWEQAWTWRLAANWWKMFQPPKINATLPFKLVFPCSYPSFLCLNIFPKVFLLFSWFHYRLLVSCRSCLTSCSFS